MFVYEGLKVAGRESTKATSNIMLHTREKLFKRDLTYGFQFLT